MKMRNDAGFSLIEMIIALAVTLVVTGAVYGLISGGNNAFRREPEMTDRQQNVRMAMDLIMRDVQNSGSGLPAFIQAFSRGLDSCSASNTSPAGFTKPNRCLESVSTPATTFNTGILSGAADELPDDLELIGNPGNLDGEQTCHYPGGSSAVVRLRYGSTNIVPPQIALVLMANGTYAIVNINDMTTNNSGAGDCDAGEEKVQLQFNQGGDPTDLNQPGGMCAGGVTGTAAGLPNSACNPIMVAHGEVVRYGIRRDSEGVPNLYRFSTSSLLGGGPPDWQLVAKGVEDMQVQYRSLDAGTLAPATNWSDEPPQVAGCDPANPNVNCCDPGCVEPSCKNRTPCAQPNNAALARLVTEVRVTLSARSEARSMQGESSSVAGGTRLRGSLTQTISPRTVLFALSRRDPAAGAIAWR